MVEIDLLPLFVHWYSGQRVGTIVTASEKDNFGDVKGCQRGWKLVVDFD